VTIALPRRSFHSNKGTQHVEPQSISRLYGVGGRDLLDHNLLHCGSRLQHFGSGSISHDGDHLSRPGSRRGRRTAGGNLHASSRGAVGIADGLSAGNGRSVIVGSGSRSGDNDIFRSGGSCSHHDVFRPLNSDDQFYDARRSGHQFYGSLGTRDDVHGPHGTRDDVHGSHGSSHQFFRADHQLAGPCHHFFRPVFTYAAYSHAGLFEFCPWLLIGTHFQLGEVRDDKESTPARH
jgi:hypothetical protein